LAFGLPFALSHPLALPLVCAFALTLLLPFLISGAFRRTFLFSFRSALALL
jgi:hypothetical protein